MSASRQEIAELTDQILEKLGVRIGSGQLTLHYHDGVLQRIEASNTFRLKPGERLETTVLLDRTRPRR